MENKKNCECTKCSRLASCHGKDEKSEFYNSWDSVPKTYDSAESFHKHEKTAGNNQWCSTHK